MMEETVAILNSILEEYERKADAIRAAIRAVESSSETETKPFNIVRKNEPFDFSKIKDFNPHGGGIRADI